MQQLAAFQRALDKFTNEGVGIVAASTDPADKAEETVGTQGLKFPVGYGLDVRATAATLGAFYEDRRGILQSTGYVIKPDRIIAVAQYSSGPIGRLVWQDVLGLVQHYKKQTG